MKYLFPKDFFLAVPVSVAVGAGLAALQPGPFWAGWLGFSVLLILGLSALLTAWRWAGGGKLLAWLTGLALVLRLAAGVAVYVALPINGHNVADDKAGFVFTDAHRRDDQAWELASSEKPLWDAFNKSYYTDQYGGLLALSALTYKALSPDAHRPLLILLLAALTAALGVSFFKKAIRKLWGENLAGVASWFFVLYPESVLTGGAQMREPFLLTLIAVCLWGFAEWLEGGGRRSLIWVAAGLCGMLLVSPAMALALLVLFGGWLWTRGEHERVRWPIIVGVAGVFLIGVLFLAWSLTRPHDFGGGSPIVVILNWLRESVKYVVYQLEHGSGQIQNVFAKINPLAQFLFVVAYGVAQPVLPPAFFAPTTITWHIIAIYRAIGWYLILPLLIYAPIAAWRSDPGPIRRLWLWLSAFVWSWIGICAIRAGGSQWDNPRYRLIFFGFEALLAGFAWIWWREHRDAWLPRILALEVLSVLLFGQWYLARYNHVGVHLPIMLVLSLSLGIVVFILIGGWLWDRIKAEKGNA